MSILKNRNKIRNMTLIAFFAVMLAVCSWISIPLAVPVTLQTFGVFFILFYAGGKKALASLLLYIALGIIGLPVFSGFGNGLSVLIGPTGGYIAGFVVAGAVYFAAETILKQRMNRLLVKYCVSVIALLACYALGTLGVMNYFSNSSGYLNLYLSTVAVYGIADTVKIICAGYLSRYLQKCIG